MVQLVAVFAFMLTPIWIILVAVVGGAVVDRLGGGAERDPVRSTRRTRGSSPAGGPTSG